MFRTRLTMLGLLDTFCTSYYQIKSIDYVYLPIYYVNIRFFCRFNPGKTFQGTLTWYPPLPLPFTGYKAVPLPVLWEYPLPDTIDSFRGTFTGILRDESKLPFITLVGIEL